MKILYHHRIRSKDGQYVHIEEMTNALKKLGHEIIMVGPAAVENEAFGADAGMVAVLKKYLPRFVYELLELAYAVKDYGSLVAAVKQHRPDCIYERYNLYLPSGVWLKQRFKLPMLLEVNAPLYDERKKYDGIALDRLAKWSEHFAWRGADYVLPVTQVLAETVRRAGVPVSKIAVIPNGINLENFASVPEAHDAKTALGLQNCLVLGFIGFVREWHGIERVIDLVANDQDKKLHLLLVGDGPARESLEKHAKALAVADRVTFTGIIPRSKVASYIAAFDVALQPEVVAYASPLKLFEYLALGRAIVAPATANIKEILVHEQNALLFDPKDPVGFYTAVRRLCEDAPLRARIATAARSTIAKLGLTWTNNAIRVTQLFSQLASSRHAKPR